MTTQPIETDEQARPDEDQDHLRHYPVIHEGESLEGDTAVDEIDAERARQASQR